MTRKYLVVDDNLEFAENVAEILSTTGAEVCLASEGLAALECIKHTRFDGVVTDMSMPGLSGTQLLRRLRQVDPGVPVVLLSAFVQPEDVAEAQQLGLLACINKPADTTQLVQLLALARRDAAVVLIDGNRAMNMHLTRAMTARGFTVCAVESLQELNELGVKPLAALMECSASSEVQQAAVAQLKAHFPGIAVMVATPGEHRDAAADIEVLLARLEALNAGGLA